MRQSVLFLIVDCLFSVAFIVTECQIGSDGTNAGDQNQAGAQQTQDLPGTAAQERLGAEQRVPQTQPAPGLRREQQRMSNYGTFRDRPWFENRSVREQLGLNDNEYNDLNRSYGNAYGSYRRRMAELNDLSNAQRRERLREYRQEFNNTFSQNVDRVFTDPERRTRYNQLYNQYRNYNTFNDPTVRQQLNLTPQQRQQLSRYSRAWNDDMRRLERAYANNPDRVSQQYRQLQDRYWDQVESLLNDQQRQTWQGMTGERYDFPPETYWDTPRTASRETIPPTTSRSGASSNDPSNQPPNPTPQ